MLNPSSKEASSIGTLSLHFSNKKKDRRHHFCKCWSCHDLITGNRTPKSEMTKCAVYVDAVELKEEKASQFQEESIIIDHHFV